MSFTVVVTGASGFVGAQLVQDLSANGLRVVALSRRTERWNGHPRVKAIQCNWTPAAMEPVVREYKSVDGWIHAAAAIDFKPAESRTLYRDNALLTSVIAESLAPSSHLIYLSTVSVYGAGQAVSSAVIPEPESDYGMSKLLGEKLCLAATQGRCSILRLAGVWGSGEPRPKLFINKCLNSARAGQPFALNSAGTGRRNYIWVKDIPNIVRASLEKKWSGVRIVAAHEALRMREMAEKIAQRFGVEFSAPADSGVKELDTLAECFGDYATTAFDSALQCDGANAP